MSGHISKEFTQELLARVNIVELIDERVPLKKAGANFVACCPFHKEKTPSFSVNLPKQFYHCFGCGKSGNALTFLIEHDRLNFIEAVTYLAEKVSLPIPHQQKGEYKKKQSHQNLYQLLAKVSLYYQQALQHSPKAQAYLAKRGLTASTIQHFGIGYAPPGWENILNSFKNYPEALHYLQQGGMIVDNQRGGFYDRFRERLMFPILDRQGRTIAFGGRVFDDSTPKYLNSPETPIFHKGKELYGLFEASKAHAQLQYILIVEGYMDTIVLHQFGITNVAATLGTATTPQHFERLFRYTSNIIFCFDGDKAGKEAAWRALQIALTIITEGRQIRFLFLPNNEDPDSLIQKEGKEAFQQRIHQDSIALSQFLFKHLQKNIDLGSLDGKAQFIKEIKPYIEKMPKSLYQQMMIDELARITRVSSDRLFAEGASSPILSQKNKHSNQRLTPIRLAIALLLHHPSLYQFMLELDDLIGSPLPGIELLISLHDTIKKTPEMTTAMLLEVWRDTDQAMSLHKLLQWEHMIPEVGIENEFIGALARIKQQVLELKIEHLMQKASTLGLAESEKITLQNYIARTKISPKTTDLT